MFLQQKRWPIETPEPSQFDGTAVRLEIIDRYRPIVDGDLPDADVVIATFWRTVPWVAAMSPKKGVKVVFLQGYETSLNQWDSDIDNAWFLPLHKIVVSNWLKDLAKTRFSDRHVTCIPNSVDTDIFYSNPRDKQPVPTVGFLYNPLHLKGIDVSLAALTRVKQILPDLRVIAFGAEQISARFPLPRWIEFYYRPTQSQIRYIYCSCDVWLCGSRQEGFHLPPLEAMACGCPVVSTRVGGPQDIIQDGDNGFLVDVEDHENLARRALQILEMKNVNWGRMSSAAFKAATSYTWDDATNMFEDTLTELVRHGNTDFNDYIID